MGLANQLRNGKLGLGYVKAIKVFYFVFNVYLKTLMTVLLWIVCKYVLVTNEINYLNTYNIVKIGKTRKNECPNRQEVSSYTKY